MRVLSDNRAAAGSPKAIPTVTEVFVAEFLTGALAALLLMFALAAFLGS